VVDRLVVDRNPFGASYPAFDVRHGYPSPQLVEHLLRFVDRDDLHPSPHEAFGDETSPRADVGCDAPRPDRSGEDGLLPYSVGEEALSKLLPSRCNLVEVGVRRLASLDRHGLREIPGVVRVVSLLHGRPVRHQLKRYRLQYWREILLRPGYLDEVRVDLARFIGDPDHPRSPRLQLLRVREGVGVRLPSRVDDDHGGPVLYQSQRSVLQLA